MRRGFLLRAREQVPAEGGLGQQLLREPGVLFGNLQRHQPHLRRVLHTLKSRALLDPTLLRARGIHHRDDIRQSFFNDNETVSI